MSNALVSVVIPTYNRAHSVVDAIRSVQAQTYSPVQIVVVDDGSSDDTRQRVSGMTGVEYYAQTRGGQGAARNYGLQRCNGEYIASLDSDDLWDADFLSTSVEALERLDVDFVFTNWRKLRGAQLLPSEWLINRKWVPLQTAADGDWWTLTPAQTRQLFLDICPAPSSSLLLRRQSIVSGWGEGLLIADDWYLLLEMALVGSCRCAFTLQPRWRKRVDGRNVYDGRPAIDALRELYLHDARLFRRRLAGHLTTREQARLRWREVKYRTFLHGHRIVRSPLAERVGLRALASTIRPLARWLAS